MLASEERVQYFNSDALVDLNDVSLSQNEDLLIASGPANELDTVVYDAGLGSIL